MKLQTIEHRGIYHFALTFENGAHREVDLQALIGQHVAVADVQTARIDPEWGCLEFLHGQVDIEPKTLYRYAGFKAEPLHSGSALAELGHLARRTDDDRDTIEAMPDKTPATPLELE